MTTILSIDAIIFAIVGLWYSFINATGNTDERGGAGFVAFVIISMTLFISAVAAVITLIIGLLK